MNKRVSWQCSCGAITFALRNDDGYLVAPHLKHEASMECEKSRTTVTAMVAGSGTDEETKPMTVDVSPFITGSTIPPKRRSKIAQQLQGEQVRAMSKHIVELQGRAERLTVALRRASEHIGDSRFGRELEAVLEVDGAEEDDEPSTTT